MTWEINKMRLGNRGVKDSVASLTELIRPDRVSHTGSHVHWYLEVQRVCELLVDRCVEGLGLHSASPPTLP